MFTFTAEAIIFALHSSIRLSAQLRKAYANTLKTRSLVLPLPAFNGNVELSTAEDFFNGEGAKFCEMVSHLAKLHDLVERKPEDELSDEIKDDYLTYYKAYWQVLNGHWHGLTTDDLSSLMLIRQWETGKEPITSPLQVVAGTLVEIGIDFFNQIPGAVHPNSIVGKYLKSFLSGIDNVDFAESGDLKRVLIHQIVPQMFVASAETIGQLSDEMTDEPKLQNFIQATSFGLTEDIQHRIENMPTDGDQQEVIRWGQLIFRSMIRNSTQYVFTHPNESIGTGMKETELVRAIGEALMSVMLDEQPNMPIRFKEVFTIESLDKVVQSALVVVAEYPSLLANQNGLKAIISGVASALAQSGINRPALLPELVQLVMLQTAGNLDTLFNTESGQAKHLLVTALSPILTTLAPKDIHAKWQPKLTNAEILSIVNNVFDEVVDNPSWLESKVNGETLLGEVIHSTYGALASIPEGNRLKGSTLELLIQINLRTAASNSQVLGKIKWGTGEEETTVLQKALDLIFAHVFRDTTNGNRTVLLLDLVDYVINILIAKYPNKTGLTLTLVILSDEIGLLLTNGGLDHVKANELVNVALATITQHPELIAENLGIQNIVTGVAEALHNTNLPLSKMLPEFVRLTLEKTGGNLDLLVDSRRRKQKFILILALQQILKAISQSPASGKWKPTLTGSQIQDITSLVFDQILQNPHLVKNDFVLILMRGVFKALERVPNSKPVPYIVLKSMIEDAFAAINFRKQLMFEVIDTDGGRQKLAINYSLDGLFIALYDNEGGTTGSWTLTQGPILEAIVNAFLTRITTKSVTKTEIDTAIAIIKEAVKDLNENKAFVLEELLERLAG